MAFDFYEWSMRAYLNWKTARRGEKVGIDSLGNTYYVDKRSKGTRTERRWVVFKGESEASSVPPEWHGWLHQSGQGSADRRQPLPPGLAERADAEP